MKCFYADIVRGGKVAFLAGPFPSEAVAREWVEPAFKMAAEIDPRAWFDPAGVVAVEDVFHPGVLNARLKVPAEQLAQPIVA